ncbi:3-isopropylmalate dehydrogenase [Acuticoccus sp. M5D2P5]|uniref:3-isopropylmalate dehydrogenase n=1 Tax=Acuticoccus kalidii TaxID=2910977 RepID=UPI001F3C224B|nr:3-isopropylmalate dehydrogenase [Acuticoccus kalidii]
MSGGHVLVVPGDGIGPEVVAVARRVLDWCVAKDLVGLTFEEAAVGGAAIETIGRPIADETVARAKASDAVLFGSVGGPGWDEGPPGTRAGDGLFRLRRELGLFANLRPIRVSPALEHHTSLKPETVRGVDFVIVRELTGGIYFGEPRGVEPAEGGERGFNTMTYTSAEVRRVANSAFALARKRGGWLHSVDKSNVLEVSGVWRRAVTALHADTHADTPLHHILVDNCCLQLIRDPSQFDVLVMSNMFGDILSDGAGALTGSLGMLPSASLGEGTRGLYEPIHGTAPDIAGQGIANPCGMILSAAMMLEHSFDRKDLADRIVAAVDDVLLAGTFTADLAGSGPAVSTDAFGDAVIAALERG